MIRWTGLFSTLGLTALIAVGVACSSGSPPPSTETVPLPAPALTGEQPASGSSVTSAGGQIAPGSSVASSVETAVETASGAPLAVASVGSMMPFPGSAEELVKYRQLHIVLLGTIESVLEERVAGGYGVGGGYGDDGQLVPVDDGQLVVPVDEVRLHFTDYQLRIERVLIDDGTVAEGDTIVLRMFGHRSSQQGTLSSVSSVSSVSFDLPKQGDRLLFALHPNPDGTYGSVPQGLLNIDGAQVEFAANGRLFGTGISPEQLIQDILDLPPLS